MKKVTEKDTFDFFNSDISLLAINILLEGYYRGQSIFTLDQFLKGNYWEISEIKERIKDTNDYTSIEDLVLNQAIDILESLNLGKIRRMGLMDFDGLLRNIVKEIVKAKNGDQDTEDMIDYYTEIVSEACDLKRLISIQVKKALKEHKYEVGMSNQLELQDDSQKHLSFIASFAAPFLEFRISFIDKRAKEIHKELDDYIFCFSQDDFIDESSSYKEKRFYFSKQLENFFNYVISFPAIDGYVNIPFSSLREKGFEVVKVLNYLEMNKRAKVRNWNDTDLWNVRFFKTPITIESLTLERKGNEKYQSKTEEKDLLTFNQESGLLIINKERVKIKKYSDQFYLLKVLFENEENIYKEFLFDELDDYEDTMGWEDKKIRNTVQNLNTKLALTTNSKVKNFLLVTSKAFKINKKYLPDSS